MFDALTLAAIVDEVAPLIHHGRVQRVLLLDDLSLGLEIYAGHHRHQLLISAHARDARLHLVGARLTADRERVTPFLLLLRKYVRGGLVLAMTQPALERTVALSIVKRLPLDKPLPRADALVGASTGDPAVATAGINPPTESVDVAPSEEGEGDDGPNYEVVVQLIVEIMGRHSNIILVDGGGAILESIKRVPATVNRYRTVLPRRPYVPPPDQAKADPRAVDAAWWEALLARSPQAQPLAPLLVRELRAISPQVAREIAARVTGRTDALVGNVAGAAPLAAVVTALMALVERHAWSPHIYREDDRVAAFSPFPLVSLATLRTELVTSMSVAVEAGIGHISATTGHGQSRVQLVERLTADRARVAARQAALAEQLAVAAAAEQWRAAGEQIFAYLHTLTPGQTRLEIDGTAIALDPTLTPVANAQAYFDRYRRARAAAAHVPDLIDGVEQELAYLDQLLLFARQADTLADLHAVEAEWRDRSAPSIGNRRAPVSRAPRRLRTVAGDRLLVGRNGRQNDQVTFDLAGPDDLWLHARGLPGAHVILQLRPGLGEPPQRLIEAAAQLAAYYSPARDAAGVEVDVTPRRWVRKVKGGPPGLVTYRNEYTVRVAPAGEATLRQRGVLVPE